MPNNDSDFFNPERQQLLQQEIEKAKERKNQERLNLKSRFTKVKEAAKTASNLSKVFKMSDLAFLFALVAAVFKDILDLFGTANPLYFLIVILTILIFIFIGFMIFLGVMMDGPKLWGKIISALIGGTIFEILPGLDLLPATIGIVVGIYLLVLKHRRKKQLEIRKTAASKEINYAY